jgi:4-amino-4-deoxy-L-arabinose transferase-like glycosyltransferase
LRAIFWVITLLAGFLQGWAVRYTASTDAVNYLDAADGYLRGDWQHAVNAYWSPFFSWILAVGLKVFHPQASREAILLHFIGLAGLLVALGCFEFFFRTFLLLQKRPDVSTGEEDPLPETGWWALGYGLFLSTALIVHKLEETTPDIWVLAFTLLAAGLLLKIYAEGGGARWFSGLGLVLGCAYLTKAFYLPMSFVFLVGAWLAAGSPRKAFKEAILAVAVFGLVAGPWIVLLSRTYHRFTYGDVGKLAYIMTVDRIPRPFLWRGENGTGVPEHAPRQLWSEPALFEFATPVEGTNPLGFGAAYWMEGARPRFDLRGQLLAVRQSAGTFLELFFKQIEYGVGLLFLFFLAAREGEVWALLRHRWFLWLPSLLACGAYSLVLVEGRYVAPFILLLWLAGYSILFSASQLSRPTATAMVLAVLSVTGLRAAKSMEKDTAASRVQENLDWQVCEGLQTLGVRAGERIADVGGAGKMLWAHQAGVRLVAEIPFGEQGTYWGAEAETRRKILQVFAGTGASVVVTKDPPPWAVKEGWIPLGKTGFYVYRFT